MRDQIYPRSPGRAMGAIVDWSRATLVSGLEAMLMGVFRVSVRWTVVVASLVAFADCSTSTPSSENGAGGAATGGMAGAGGSGGAGQTGGGGRSCTTSTASGTSTSRPTTAPTTTTASTFWKAPRRTRKGPQPRPPCPPPGPRCASDCPMIARSISTASSRRGAIATPSGSQRATRTFLAREGWAELGPPGFYDPRSIPFEPG